jgi:hypothetical protein
MESFITIVILLFYNKFDNVTLRVPVVRHMLALNSRNPCSVYCPTDDALCNAGDVDCGASKVESKPVFLFGL